MVRYEKDRLVITLDLENWGSPAQCRSELMKSLIDVIGSLDHESLSGNRLELFWLCRLLRGLVDE